MGRITVIVGAYGSGKTEISLNMALKAAAKDKVTLVDLDIVNPYFRAAEHKALLHDSGVRLLCPSYAMTAVDIPALPAEILSVFSDRARRVIFDVGGDAVGATALGRYKAYFDRDDYEMLYVINTLRPMSDNVADILQMMQAVQQHARLSVTGLISNTNLAHQTRAEHIVRGAGMVEQVGKIAGLPLLWVGVREDLSQTLPDSFYQRYQKRLMPIQTYMRPDWLV